MPRLLRLQYLAALRWVFQGRNIAVWLVGQVIAVETLLDKNLVRPTAWDLSCLHSGHLCLALLRLVVTHALVVYSPYSQQ